MRDLLVLAILAAGIPLAFWRPWIGLVWFVLIGFGRVQDYTWGSVQSQSWSMYYSVILVLSSFLHGYWMPMKDSAFTRLLIIFSLLLGVTNFFAIAPNLAWEGYGELWKTLAVIFFAMSLLDTSKKLHFIILVVACCFALHGTKYGMHSLLRGGSQILFGPGGKFPDNNGLGMVTAVSLPLLVYFAAHFQNYWGRWCFRIAIIPHVATVIFTYSRGALVGLITASLVIILTSRHKFKALFIFPILAVLIFNILPASYKARISTMGEGLEDSKYQREEKKNTSSNEERIELFKRGLQLTKERPLTGVGMGNYLIGKDYFALGGPNLLPHNSLILATAEGGFIVLFFYLSLFVASWVTQWKNILRPITHPDDLRRKALFKALFASTLTFFINGLFNNHPWFDLHFFLFLFTMLADKLEPVGMLSDDTP